MKKDKNIKIEININKTTEIFNKFNNKQLSDELNNYIYNQCKGVSVSNVIINIHHINALDNNEKKEIIDSIRENFGLDIKENMIRLKYETISQILLILIGCTSIILSKLLNNLNTIILGELIYIFGCVLIWEVIYNIVFTNTKTKIENKRLKKLTKAKINFIEKN